MNKISFFRNLMYKRRIRKEALLIKMPDKYKTASIEELFTKIKTFYQNKNYQEILFLEYYNKDYLKCSIQVTPIGKGIYYGWSVNSNNRFLLKK